MNMYVLNLALLTPYVAIGLSMLLLVAVFIWYRTQKADQSPPHAMPSHPDSYHANRLQPTPKELDIALIMKPELPEIPLSAEERRIAQEYLASHPF